MGSLTNENIPESYTVNQVFGRIQNIQHTQEAQQADLDQIMNTRIVLPQSFLKKFFAKARTAEPRLTQDISTTISKFYTELREKS